MRVLDTMKLARMVKSVSAIKTAMNEAVTCTHADFVEAGLVDNCLCNSHGNCYGHSSRHVVTVRHAKTDKGRPRPGP